MGDNEEHQSSFNRACNLRNRNFLTSSNKQTQYQHSICGPINIQQQQQQQHHNDTSDETFLQIDNHQQYQSSHNHDRMNQLKMNAIKIMINNNDNEDNEDNEDNLAATTTSEIDLDPSELPVMDKVYKFEQLKLEMQQQLPHDNSYNNDDNNHKNSQKNNNITVINITDGIISTKLSANKCQQQQPKGEPKNNIIQIHHNDESLMPITTTTTTATATATAILNNNNNDNNKNFDDTKERGRMKSSIFLKINTTNDDKSEQKFYQQQENDIKTTPTTPMAITSTYLTLPSTFSSVSSPSSPTSLTLHNDKLNFSMNSTSSIHLTDDITRAGKAQHFIRKYRNNPRPKTEIIDATVPFLNVPHKYSSLHKPKINHYKSMDDEAATIELRDKGVKSVEPILDELIKTEENYVDSLWSGINNYSPIFQRNDLPSGLRGKKYILLGNVEQLAEFHRDEFLPMLKRNRHNLKAIFEEFIQFIDENCFYGYVLFTINKKHSLKLCDIYKNYFKMIQTELDDKLGINSFLVQPIQRMARYPLLLQQFITTLFKNRRYDMKSIIESCCRLEKRLRNLLIIINESEIINDIVCSNETSDFNVLFQGKFRKVSEFHVYDHTRKRSYRSKVFIFDMCIIYTEMKGQQLLYQGRYPREHIGIVAKTKSFTLYYDQRKQQECEFHGDAALIETWLDLIRDMITSYAIEEKRKLIELHTKEHSKSGDHRCLLGQPPNLSLFRDSNRFSSDSGIGNIWVLPKSDLDDASFSSSTLKSPSGTPTNTPTANQTTWYAIT